MKVCLVMLGERPDGQEDFIGSRQWFIDIPLEENTSTSKEIGDFCLALALTCYKPYLDSPFRFTFTYKNQKYETLVNFFDNSQRTRVQ